MNKTGLKYLIRPLVRELHPYVYGEQPKIKGLIKLNTNENPYPPSPKVVRATRAAVDGRLLLYPNPTAQPLREKLARVHGCRPENIIEKMVEGRIRKFYEEVVLVEQVWVHDGESRVKAVLQKAGVKLAGFERFQLGEGIDKPQGPDFASEVAATAGV